MDLILTFTVLLLAPLAALPIIKKLLDSLPKDAGSNSPHVYLQRVMERIVAVLEGREPALVYPTSVRPSTTN